MSLLTVLMGRKTGVSPATPSEEVAEIINHVNTRGRKLSESSRQKLNRRLGDLLAVKNSITKETLSCLLDSMVWFPESYDKDDVATLILWFQDVSDEFAERMVEMFKDSPKFVKESVSTHWVRYGDLTRYSNEGIIVRSLFLENPAVTSDVLMRYIESGENLRPSEVSSIMEDARLPEEFVMTSIMDSIRKGENIQWGAISNPNLSESSLRRVFDALKTVLDSEKGKDVVFGDGIMSNDPFLKLMMHPNTPWDLFKETWELKRKNPADDYNRQNRRLGALGYTHDTADILKSLNGSSKTPIQLVGFREKLMSFPEFDGMPLEWIVALLEE